DNGRGQRQLDRHRSEVRSRCHPNSNIPDRPAMLPKMSPIDQEESNLRMRGLIRSGALLPISLLRLSTRSARVPIADALVARQAAHQAPRKRRGGVPVPWLKNVAAYSGVLYALRPADRRHV